MIKRCAGAIWLAIAGLGVSIGPALASPPLWVIEHERATVYMVGTIHLMREEVEWRTPAFDEAFEEADTVWLELLGADDAETIGAAMLEYALSPDLPLSERLDADDLELLESALEPYGIPLDSIDDFRPWFAALQLTTLPLQAAGFDPQYSLDLVIESEAEATGKALHAFETAEEQLLMLSGMSEEVQLEMLRQTAADMQDAGEALVEQVDAWVAGDLDALAAAVDETYAMAPEFHDRLFVQRNIAFADTIEEILSGEGVTLVAVGLGHFVGDGSIPQLLEDRGYEIETR